MNKAEGIILTESILYYKALVIKQYGIGIKRDTLIMEQNKEPRNKGMHI